jgi:hypothetical protein
MAKVTIKSLLTVLIVLFMITPLLILAQGGLVAYWPLDEGTGATVTDVYGGYTGELMEGADWSTDHKFGTNSLFFAGTDWVQTNLMEVLQNANEFTLCAWFNTDITDEGQQHILWIGDVAGNGYGQEQECHLSVNHFTYLDKVVFNFGDSLDTEGRMVNIVSENDFTDAGVWHHMAGVIRIIEGDTSMLTIGELYLDGELQVPLIMDEYPTRDTVYYEVKRDLWNTSLRIGNSGVTDTRGFQGVIDEIQVYDIALTKEQIETVMTGAVVADVKESKSILPAAFYLLENYPNPFNPITMINYQLPMTNEVELSIYNLVGQKIATLVSERQAAGTYRVHWDASGFASGVYLYRLHAGNYVETKKMVLVR